MEQEFELNISSTSKFIANVGNAAKRTDKKSSRIAFEGFIESFIIFKVSICFQSPKK